MFHLHIGPFDWPPHRMWEMHTEFPIGHPISIFIPSHFTLGMSSRALKDFFAKSYP
jgi:hypothetical protein